MDGWGCEQDHTVKAPVPLQPPHDSRKVGLVLWQGHMLKGRRPVKANRQSKHTPGMSGCRVREGSPSFSSMQYGVYVMRAMNCMLASNSVACACQEGGGESKMRERSTCTAPSPFIFLFLRV
eukprot:1152615-Pelagomonas_calceolata.AAC.6